MRSHRIHQPPGGNSVTQVRADRERIPALRANRLHDFLGAISRFVVVHGHAGAVPREAQRDRTADAESRAGYERDPFAEFHAAPSPERYWRARSA